MNHRRERPPKRDVNGLILLDKPLGLSSNTALQIAKRLFAARKAGHTGSLDPQATGMLPLCFGEATKLSAFLLDADKAYTFTCQLGVTTTTADAEGEIVEERPVPALTAEVVERVLQPLRGLIMQVPPMYSALRHNGKRLYELARQGLEVERQAREVMIYALELQSIEESRLKLAVRCSKGTYVRTLAEDIGKALGCGAHVVALRRTEVGPFSGLPMITLDALEAAESHAQRDAWLLPMDTAVAQWPALILGDDAAHYLSRGQPVLVPRSPTSGRVRLYSRDDRFMGVGEILDDGRVAPRRLMNAA